MQTSIDISIVTYNSSKWLTPFFKSLASQNYPLSQLNIFIHDNDSQDDTFNLIEKLKLQYQKKFGAFEIGKSLNKGFGYGHNKNFKKGNADYFLVTNVDLTFEKTSLEKIINIAIAELNNQVASWEFRQKPYEHPKYYHPVTLETHWSSSACILFQRTAFQQIKGYDERIFLYGEDVDISYRLRDQGYILKYCPTAVCWHYSYEHANQLKAAQFFGSTLANIYLRLRFGSFKEIIFGFLMYLKLFFIQIDLSNYSKTLFKNLCILFKNMAYFLCSRKKSNLSFLFNDWDYGLRREGAFYSCSVLYEENLPLVSVIIRTYKGRSGWLKEAVTSVLNQTYSAIELIIVEDGSETAKDFVMELVQKNILKNIIYQPIEKAGRCVAGNTGLSLATGDYIVFLDDDDLFFADHIEILVSALLENSSVQAAYSLAWEIPTELIQLTPLIYKEQAPFLRHHQPYSRYVLWDHNFLSIQSIMFHRKLYLECGGFDITLEAMEDWDLWIRYSLMTDFKYVEKLTSFYRVPPPGKNAIEREVVINKYHKIVIAKQKGILIKEISIREIMIASHEILDCYANIKTPVSFKQKIISHSLIIFIFYKAYIKIKKLMLEK
jgi:GT2 family glycosyltransferase